VQSLSLGKENIMVWTVWFDPVTLLLIGLAIFVVAVFIAVEKKRKGT